MLKITDLNPSGRKFNVLPDEAALESIPPANRADFDLKDKEVKAARRFIYAVNKVNKMRLMVWRVK
jgi:hypothetical protein